MLIRREEDNTLSSARLTLTILVAHLRSPFLVWAHETSSSAFPFCTPVPRAHLLPTLLTLLAPAPGAWEPALSSRRAHQLRLVLGFVHTLRFHRA